MNNTITKTIAGAKVELSSWSGDDYYYLDVTQAAKIIRRLLKAKFPETKFSVKCDKYSMGSSMDISWFDGPTKEMVEKIARNFETKDFDGMNDMSYGKDSWLLPDGSCSPAYSPGTIGSAGADPSYDYPAPNADAIKITGDFYIFTNRHTSPKFLDVMKTFLVMKGYPIEKVEIKESEYNGSGWMDFSAYPWGQDRQSWEFWTREAIDHTTFNDGKMLYLGNEPTLIDSPLSDRNDDPICAIEDWLPEDNFSTGI